MIYRVPTYINVRPNKGMPRIPERQDVLVENRTGFADWLCVFRALCRAFPTRSCVRLTVLIPCGMPDDFIPAFSAIIAQKLGFSSLPYISFCRGLPNGRELVYYIAECQYFPDGIYRYKKLYRSTTTGRLCSQNDPDAVCQTVKSKSCFGKKTRMFHFSSTRQFRRVMEQWKRLIRDAARQLGADLPIGWYTIKFNYRSHSRRNGLYRAANEQLKNVDKELQNIYSACLDCDYDPEYDADLLQTVGRFLDKIRRAVQNKNWTTKSSPGRRKFRESLYARNGCRLFAEYCDAQLSLLRTALFGLVPGKEDPNVLVFHFASF